MADVGLLGVNKWYGDFHAVNDLNLTIHDREFMVILGPSGSGKTTALRMIAGLETLDSGEIRIGDRRVDPLPPKDRDIAMVFQNYALFAHMTVAENIGFGLRMAKSPEAEVKRRVLEVAELLGLGAVAVGQAPPPFGRHAAARGAGTGHRPQRFALSDGRAAFQS